MIVAIDGPAGAGKSTVSRLLAQKLQYVYLDTGAMYRAVAWAILREGVDLEDEALVGSTLPLLPLRFSVENNSMVIYHRGQVLDEEIRRPEITRHSSRVSRIPSVRAFLNQWQKRLAAEGGIVAEGRDMATVVFPDAEVKVFLTADLPTRTGRRHAEYLQKNIPIDYADLEAQIRERDEADSKRAIAPLRPAPGAVILDTSGMDIAEVVSRLMELVAEKSKNN
jgi:cytidylate kinase